MTEVEVLLEELVELESESVEVAKEKKQATEMRERALERFGETRKGKRKLKEEDQEEEHWSG